MTNEAVGLLLLFVCPGDQAIATYALQALEAASDELVADLLLLGAQSDRQVGVDVDESPLHHVEQVLVALIVGGE